LAIWNRTFEICQNQTEFFTLGFASADPSGQLSLAVPYNFNSGSFEFTACFNNNPASGTLFTPLTGTYSSGSFTFGTQVVSGATVATISWTLPFTTTVLCQPGTYYCDLLWKNGSSYVYLAAGPLIVSPSVSR
jgi:hypothetical protein